MRLRINIITAFPITIPHPRVEMEKRVLQEAGYHVEVLSFPEKPNFKERLRNYLSGNFFKKHVFHKILSNSSETDLVILYDLQLLPLVKKFDRRNIKVIYETIDNMVHLNTFELVNQAPFLKAIKWVIIHKYEALEKRLARKCNGVIVNSKALQQYFHPIHTALIYYTSPFEGIYQNVEPTGSAALVYLGFFSRDKGGYETLALQEEYDLPLFIFGDIKDRDLQQRVMSGGKITWVARKSPEELGKALIDLRNQFRLLGCSIIHSIHYSYASQEANKDQDYLALGIPLIGNQRMPTLEKIDAGCGVLYTNRQEILGLIQNTQKYNEISNKARAYYEAHYSYNIYKQSLLQAVSSASGQTN